MAADIAFFNDRLLQKDKELAELQTSYNKFRLKTKVKLDQLKQDVTQYCNDHQIACSEDENPALLRVRLVEAETGLADSKLENERMGNELVRRQMQINDQIILIRSLEDRLLEVLSTNEKTMSDRRRANQQLDLERIHQQMMYKDERIVELNNVILDRERQILDLQETCREQGEVANVKNQAMRIVQRKFEEIESKTRKEVGTETDPYLSQGIQPNHWETQRASRGTSPGRLNVSARVPAGTHNGQHSPPPLDPMEGQNFRETMYEIGEPGPSNSFDDDINGKRGRKRVTFDLPPSAASSSLTLNMPLLDNARYESEIKMLESENNKLHDLLKEKDIIIAQQKTEIGQVDENTARATREGKNAALKARAVAQARIRELEDKMAELNKTYSVQTEHLQGQIETLRATREWEVEQNGTLREQISEYKNKNYKLNEELDASEKTRRDLENKSDETQKLLDQLVEELSDAEAIVVHMEDQKTSILDDVDRLKEAIEAQEQLIEVLETDIVIYEEHVGILRESLGASKVDHRSLIRSKAFETKLRALEQEKEQINRKSKEDKLRYKALAQKVKLLEQENEKLTAEICEREMGVSEDQEMMEACRHLESKIQETESQLVIERAKHATELDQIREEKDAELSEALNDLRRYRDREEANLEQTVLEHRHIEQAQQEHEELENQIEQFRAQLDEKSNLADSLQMQLDGLLGQNFELQEKCQEMTSCVNAYDTLVERHRQVARDAVELREENVRLEQEVASVIISHEEQRSRSNSVQNEYHSLKMALKEADARCEVKDKQIQELSEQIRELQSAENGAETTPSLVVDNTREIEDLRFQLQEAREKIEADKQEKKKLKLAVKQLRDGKLKPQIEQVPLPEAEVQKVIVAETQQAAVPSRSERAPSEDVEEKIRNLELECRLSGELNVEIGRAMLELEQQVDQDHLLISTLQREIEKSSAELKLKEMMHAEIKSELELARAAEQEMQNRLTQLEVENNEQGQLVESEHQTSENREHTIEELRSQVDKLQKSFEDSRQLNSEHAAQIGQLQAELYSKQDELNGERLRAETDTHSVNELKESIKTLEAERQALVATSEGYHGEILGLKSYIENIVQQLESERSIRIESESSQNHEAEQTIGHLKMQIEQLQHAQQENSVRIAGYESQIAHLQAELHQREQELHQERNSRMEAETNLANAHSSMQLLRSSFNDTTDRVAAAQRTESGQELSLLQATVATVEAVVEQNSPRTREPPKTQETPIMPQSALESENILLRQCVHQNQQMQDGVYQDVTKLLELKNELETAVDALKGEIWSLNGQLKASVLDRENLQDRVVELDTALTTEKTRADGLDRELSEQVELTEKASRQAAEAENESNRRLAECLDMESRREQLEKSYAQLTDYYNQLQAAYNMLYAQVNVVESNATNTENPNTEVTAPVAASPNSHEVDLMIANILADLQLDPATAGGSLQEKLNLIQATIKDRLKEIEESRTALQEQRNVTEALEVRLTSLEEETKISGSEVVRTKEWLLQVEGDLEWKEDECESLSRRVQELQAALDSIVARDSDEVCATTRLRTELAILAARLATRQADVDSLFRTNAELAHTNVRLQNELDENVEQLELTRSQEQVPDREDSEREELKSLLDQKTEELETVKAEVAALANSKKNLEDKIDAMESEMWEKSDTLEALQYKLKTLQAAAAVDSRQSPRKSESPKPPSESQSLIERLQEEIFALKKHLESVQTQLSTAVTDLDAAEHTADAVREELQTVKSELLTLSEHSQKESSANEREESEWGWGEEPAGGESIAVQNEDTLVALSQQLEEVQTSYKTLQAEHETLKATHEELKNDNEKLAEINDDLKDVEEDLERYRELLKKAQEAEAQLKEQLEEHKDSEAVKEPAAAQQDSDWGWGEREVDKESENQNLVAELTEKVDSLQLQYDELVAKYEEVSHSNSTLRAENHKLQDTAERLDEVQKELAHHKEQLDAALELQDQMQEQLEVQKKAVLEQESASVTQDEPEWGWGEEDKKEESSNEAVIQSLTEKVESLQTEFDELHAKYNEVSATCSTLRTENDSLLESNQDLKDVEEDLHRYKELLKEAEQKKHQLMEELEKQKQVVVAPREESQEKSAEVLNEDDGWGEDNWSAEPTNTEDVNVPEEPTPNFSVELENLQSLYDDLSKDYSSLSSSHNKLTTEKELLEQKIEKQEQLIDELEEYEEKLRAAEQREKELQQAIEAAKENKETVEPSSAWTDDNSWGEDNWGNDQEADGAKQDKTKEESASCSNEEFTRLSTEVARYSETVERLETQYQEAMEREQNAEEQVQRLRQQQQEITAENERLQSEITNLESQHTALSEELNKSQQVNSQLKTQLVDQDNSAKLEETLNELEAVKTKLAAMKNRMKELEQQNELLKDSEARLLDSVDEFGEQAEKNAERANELQKVVNDLEKKLMQSEEMLEQKLNESQIEKNRLELEINRLEKELETKSTAPAPAPQPAASSVNDAELQRVSAENGRLLEELNILKEKLTAVEQERNKVKSAYDQLRARVVARRTAVTGSRDVSRRSSIASEISEIPEQEPAPPAPVTVTLNYAEPTSNFNNSQAADPNVSRRRSAFPKK